MQLQVKLNLVMRTVVTEKSFLSEYFYFYSNFALAETFLALMVNSHFEK